MQLIVSSSIPVFVVCGVVTYLETLPNMGWANTC